MGINEITLEKAARELMIITTGQVLDKQGYKYIVIDMTSLEFISSAGIGSFLGTVETSREAGGDIILCHAREDILHVFQVLDLIDYLTIRISLDDARALCVEGR